jgi:hypothetical protein
MKKMIVLAGILFFIAIAAPIGFNIWYTNQEAQHACNALEDLTVKPAPYPANPAANPSRVATYNFYIALLNWEREDGCTSTTSSSHS